MTSVVTVVNQALLQAGTQASISSMQENSPEANVANMIYTTQIEALLRSAHWGFAREQVYLTLLKYRIDPASGAASEDPPPEPFMFEYMYPDDCIQARFVPRIYQTGAGLSTPLTTGGSAYAYPMQAQVPAQFVVATDRIGVPAVATKVILTDQALAQLVYTKRLTDNPDQWDPSFTQAAVATLAAFFVAPLSLNRALMQANIGMANSIIAQARAMDGREQLQSMDHTPDWIGVRAAGYAAQWNFAYYNTPSAMAWPSGQLY